MARYSGFIGQTGDGSGTIPVEVLPMASADELGKIYYLIPDKTYYAVQLSGTSYEWKRFVLAGGSGTGATINVNTHSINLFGAELNLKYAGNVIDSTTFNSEGYATFSGILQTGIYTLEAMYNGQVDARKSVNITSATTYGVTMTSGQVGGFLYSVIVDESNSDPAGAVTYADDCANFIPASKSTYGSWENFVKAFFRPCLLKTTDTIDSPSHYLNHDNRNYYEDGTPALKDGTEGDCMVQVSKLWYNFENIDSNRYKLSISDAKLDTEWECFNWYIQDSEYKESEYIYLPCYVSPAGGNIMKSVVGSPTVKEGNTPANWRSKASAKGTGYYNLDYRRVLLLQCMMVLLGKSLDTQTQFGGVWKDNMILPGSLDEQKFISTDVFLGIEGLFDFNTSYYGAYVDRITNNAPGQLKWTDDLSKYSDSGSEYENALIVLLPSSNGFITKVLHNNRGGFNPTAVIGSASTYYCDGCQGTTSTGGVQYLFGVGYSYSSATFARAGGFGVAAYGFTASNGSGRICRLY